MHIDNLVGTIKNVVENKGFGFIVSDQESIKKDIFFHIKDCKCPFNRLRKGDRVKFNLTTTQKGYVAEAVDWVDKEVAA